MARGPAVALLGRYRRAWPSDVLTDQTGSAPCIVSVSGAPFIMAWRFSRGSYFDLAKSFPARLINRYLRAAGALLLLPPGRASFWWIGARDRPQDALGRGPAVRGGASAQPRRAAQPLI